MTKRIVIVGATSGIAEHCARLWVQTAPAALVLVGRDQRRTEAVGADLRVRSPVSDISVMTTDFLDATAIVELAAEIAAAGRIDIVLIAHGTLPDQTECQDDLRVAAATLAINGVSPVLFAEAFARAMAVANHGTLTLIGSVAGDRGRRSNYVYGAAKGLVTRYAQGLQHRFAGSTVKVVLIKPGPTDTPMTAALKAAGAKLASVDSVARGIVAATEKGRATAYVPGKWWLIMMIIRHLPAFVFNKLNI